MKTQYGKTKEHIIEILSNEWPLSAKEIFYRVKKVSKKHVTYQGIFKSINEMVENGMITKEDKNYKLSMKWIDELKEFSKKAHEDYTKKAKPRIEVKHGQSLKKDAYEAGKEAAETALKKIEHYKEDIKLCLVLSSISYENDFDNLFKGIKSITSAPLIGMTTLGEISNEKFNDTVIAILFSGKDDNLEIETAKIDIKDYSKLDLKELNTEICFKDKSFVLAFVPGPSRHNNMKEIGAGFVEELRRYIPEGLPVIGGVAADKSRLEKTYQFYNGKTFSDSIVIATVKTNADFGIAAEHGYLRCNKDKEYSFKLDNNLIKDITVYEGGKKINSGEAINVYAKELGLNSSSLRNVMPYFTGPKDWNIGYKDWMKLTCFSKKSKPYILSFPFDIKEDNLIFTGIHNEKDKVIMMDTAPKYLIDCLKDSVKIALSKLNSEPQIVIIFPCGIFNVVIPTFKNEILEVKKINEIKGLDVIGCNVNGEIGPYGKEDIDFCNGSAICLIIGK